MRKSPLYQWHTRRGPLPVDSVKPVFGVSGKSSGMVLLIMSEHIHGKMLALQKMLEHAVAEVDTYHYQRWRERKRSEGVDRNSVRVTFCV